MQIQIFGGKKKLQDNLIGNQQIIVEIMSLLAGIQMQMEQEQVIQQTIHSQKEIVYSEVTLHIMQNGIQQVMKLNISKMME